MIGDDIEDIAETEAETPEAAAVKVCTNLRGTGPVQVFAIVAEFYVTSETTVNYKAEPKKS